MEMITSKTDLRHLERRMIYVERVLRIAEIVASKYYGASIDDIRRELDEAGDPLSKRTILRYMSLFTDFGYVSCESVRVEGRRAIRYRSVKKLPKVITGA
jgi:hypothetical protein